MSHSITIPPPDGTGEFTLYVAEPVQEPRAALLVIQEIYGVNADIRHKCDLLAQQGYLAVAPDLFWRLEPGVELDPYAAGTKEHSISLAKRFDSEAGVRDVQATINKARELGRKETKVGLIGYSLGGRMAAFAVARTNIDAAVGYYGVRIHLVLGEARRISPSVDAPRRRTRCLRGQRCSGRTPSHLGRSSDGHAARLRRSAS
jgi:carboxymethylenebutenolidase